MGEFVAFVVSYLSRSFLPHWSSGLEQRSLADCKQNETFFALPQGEKLAIAHPGTSEPQRGFSRVGAENSARLYRKGVLNLSTSEDLRDCRVSTPASFES